MLTRRRIEFLESIAGWKEFAAAESSAIKNQKLLLEMARNGEERPKYSTPLGSVLSSYTTGKGIKRYPQFNIEISEAAPHWFEDTIAITMEKLLAMARAGENKPKRGTPIGDALCSYTASNRLEKYSTFNTSIREAAPHWFEDTVAINMEKLLTMARNGKERPMQRTPLGSALCSYTTGNRLERYPQFNIDIRKAAPHWFEDTIAINMEKLLAMARNGENKPKRGTPIGDALYSYIAGDRLEKYSTFNTNIREAAPYWFKDAVAVKMAKLLAMARNGEPRPKEGTPLGNALALYTTGKKGKKYHQFNKEIRKTASHWFRSKDAVAVKMEKLLAMARNGEPRPSARTSLGSVLSSYTSGQGVKRYRQFNADIRSAASNWFEDTVAVKMAKLLAMARNGEEKPGRGTSLGDPLRYFTTGKNHEKYRQFNIDIRQAAPHWFPSTNAHNSQQTISNSKEMSA